MVIIYGKVELHLPYSRSLKEKRKIIKSINDRVRKRFNISIAEVGDHELWQKAVLGFAAVTNSHREMEHVLEAFRETLDIHEEEVEILYFDYQYAVLED